MTDLEILEGAERIPQFTLENLGYQVDGEDHGQGVGSWNFILGGPVIFVTSPSGLHLRSHHHHIAIGKTGQADAGVRGERLFIACLLIRCYAGRGAGFLETLYRRDSLDAAIEGSNEIFRDWLWREHAVEKQLDSREEIRRSDFEKAFREHTTRAKHMRDSERRARALAEEIYPAARWQRSPGELIPLRATPSPLQPERRGCDG